MTNSNYSLDHHFAKDLDSKDLLYSFKNLFHFPPAPNDKPFIYLAGNSLGLQPKTTKAFIQQELEDWAKYGVEGHFHAKNPWLPYHETLTHQTARLVGAKPIEVVVMNSLTVNLHLMLVSFYRPTQKRYKILIEGGAFPSDQYAVASHAKYHGYNPKEAIIELLPRRGESLLRIEDILETIEREGNSIALILLGNVNYLTGQAFDIAAITKAAHSRNCNIGFDLAHGVGNLCLNLHEWGPDFAVWCGYKYLNGGPGAIAGCFIHERHSLAFDLPRFTGWWGHNKNTRFQMGSQFDPIPGAEGWQLSNPPIFQLAALKASLDIFDSATMPQLRTKSEKLTGYLEFLLKHKLQERCEIITPQDPAQRGSQLSLRIRGNAQETLQRLNSFGIICDFRNPDIIRAAPVALYTTFEDVYQFVDRLADCI